MVKLAGLKAKPPKAPKAPVRSRKSKKPDALTFNQGAGFSRDPKSELFLLAVTNMVGEKTFYEKAEDRDKRFEKLIAQVALEDPDWIARFVPYLRNTMNMRSASIVMAAELVHAKLTKPVPASKIANRTIISSAIVRADEPAEMVGYWMSRFGKALPMPVKRGLADAAQRLYNERNLIKYDGGDHPIRFADVVELTHPAAKADWQDQLFRFLLNERHDHVTPKEGESYAFGDLTTLAGNRAAMAMKQEDFREQFSAEFVEANQLTWEQASSKYGKLDAKFWEAMIPSMGIFALVRNLRNFDDAEIGKEAIAIVKAKLTDPETIRKSRMFPLRFFQALTATQTLHYAEALEDAINVATSNVPRLPGKTLILVDISGSMDGAISDRSTSTRLAPASIFGAALAVQAEDATLVAFSDTSKVVPVRKNASVLLATKDIVTALPHMGTQTWQAVGRHFADHDRVIILTDEQADLSFQLPSNIVPETVPIYTFNLAGYAVGHAPSGQKNRYAFGGLSDAGFTVIELLEAGTDAQWPF